MGILTDDTSDAFCAELQALKNNIASKLIENLNKVILLINKSIS